MLKNLIGALIFTAAVLAFVNLVGDMMVNPETAPHAVSRQKAEIIKPKAKPAAPQVVNEAASEDGDTEMDEAGEAAAPMVAAAGDVNKGFKTFKRKCMGCHTIDAGGMNRTGPNLWGIVGKGMAQAERYRYSTALRTRSDTWTEENLLRFIAGPRTMIPDTKMTFAGLKKESDRINVLSFLKTLKD